MGAQVRKLIESLEEIVLPARGNATEHETELPEPMKKDLQEVHKQFFAPTLSGQADNRITIDG